MKVKLVGPKVFDTTYSVNVESELFSLKAELETKYNLMLEVHVVSYVGPKQYSAFIRFRTKPRSPERKAITSLKAMGKLFDTVKIEKDLVSEVGLTPLAVSLKETLNYIQNQKELEEYINSATKV